MKKTVFPKAAFSVAMSLETGCIVMVRARGDKQEIMGSLTREDSLKFAQGLLDWIPEAAQAPEPRPKLTLVN
jgi:hypothetical protein